MMIQVQWKQGVIGLKVVRKRWRIWVQLKRVSPYIEHQETLHKAGKGEKKTGLFGVLQLERVRVGWKREAVMKSIIE